MVIAVVIAVFPNLGESEPAEARFSMFWVQGARAERRVPP